MADWHRFRVRPLCFHFFFLKIKRLCCIKSCEITTLRTVAHSHVRFRDRSRKLSDVGTCAFPSANGLHWLSAQTLHYIYWKCNIDTAQEACCQSSFVSRCCGRSLSNYTPWVTGRREEGLGKQKGDCYHGTIKTKKGERTRSAASTTHTYTRSLNPSLTETLTIQSFETSALNGWRLSVAMRRKTPPGAWSDNFLHSWESFTFDWMETTREILFSWHMSWSDTKIFNNSSVLRSKETNFWYAGI